MKARPRFDPDDLDQRDPALPAVAREHVRACMQEALDDLALRASA